MPLYSGQLPPERKGHTNNDDTQYGPAARPGARLNHGHGAAQRDGHPFQESRFPSSAMEASRPHWRAAALAALLLTAAWCAGAWWLVERNYQARSDALIASERLQAQTRARDLAGSIRRNLHVISGVPEVMAHTAEVRNALARLAREPGLAAGTPEDRIRRWSADPRLRDLSGQLAITRNHLDVDILYVASASGDVIAASDADRAGLSIGAQVADREYFRAAREGRRSLQYAIGKATGIAGLFFASPVVLDGRFAGAVIVKVHMPNLSFLLDQSDAFLSDANGVIIMAHDKRIEMMALPGAALAALNAAEKDLRYRRQTFATVPIETWPYDSGTAGTQRLVAVAGSTTPSVIATEQLAEYGLQVHLNDAIPAIAAMRSQQIWFYLLLATLGGLVICAGCALAAYVLSLGKSRERLWRKAHFDALTGLANRELFRRRLAEALGQARRSGNPLAVMIGDIDRFKAVNDTHGHRTGDELLRHAGQQLASCVGAADTVARLGGDEFAVVLSRIGDARDALEIARQIVARVSVPVTLDNITLRPSLSLGVAIFPEDAEDAEGLLRQADQAMYAAKRQGGDRPARATEPAEPATRRLRREDRPAAAPAPASCAPQG